MRCNCSKADCHSIGKPQRKDAADIMEQTIRSYGFEPQREANNLWIIDPHYDESRPTLLLNAHIDTVKPVASWSRDPFLQM